MKKDLNDLGEPFARGNTADLYLCGGRVVKVFHPRLPDTEAAHEAGKQQLARNCGLPVPKVFRVTRVAGRQAIEQMNKT